MKLRRTLFIVTLAVLTALPGTARANTSAQPEKKGAKSARVDYLGTLPAPAAVGANFKRYADNRTYMFVTAITGLYVFDVTVAETPQPVAQLPLAHYQNEDVSLGGNRLLISGDGTAGGSILSVIDISNPRLPLLDQVINMQLADEGHTATCIQGCRYAWVAGGRSVAVLDLDAPAQLENPGAIPDVQVQAATSNVEVGDLKPVHEFGWSTHDVQVDEAEIAWVAGGNGTIGFDVRPHVYPDMSKDDPATPKNEGLLEPRVIARTGQHATADSDFDTLPGSSGSGDTVNDFIHHNSLRPDADEFLSRPTAELDAPGVRPGEVVLITEEDIWSRDTFTTPAGCESQGSFQTWQVKQYGPTGPDQGTVVNLDAWTTEFNEVVNGDENPLTGNDIVPTNGMCSAHYFDERRGIVATSWYNQGLRFLNVSDPRNIKQIAYFAAPGQATWAAYWSPTAADIVYAIDHARGVDVLRFDRKATEGGGEVTLSPLDTGSLLQQSTDETTAHPKFGFVCRLSPFGTT